MSIIAKRLESIYKEFKEITNPRLVRPNHRGDAFTLVAFEVLFKQFHMIQELSSSTDIETLERSIVIPPDGGIDIVFLDDSDGDNQKYHIVQCKYSDLTPDEIRNCIIKMRSSLDDFGERREIRKNLKKVLVENDYGKESIGDCVFYVVHKGSADQIPNQREDEKIISLKALEDCAELLIVDAVPQETFSSDSLNNFIVNNFTSIDKAEINPNVPQSILCNLSGYDLARLDRKYANTDLGRNVLYGGNLRDSLGKKSKSRFKMLDTIEKQPDLFLYYNNGVTIIAEDFDWNKDEALTLKNFSIINGAQTTSTLGTFLSDAESKNDQISIDKLKRVLVLTKIYKVNPATPDHKTVSERIRIYSNTQTPLSNRDMVSINDEQKRLQARLLNETPQIFVNIKSGETAPKPSRVPKHGDISNEALAQLGLCAFYFETHTVLGKKQQLFEPGSKDGDNCILNKTYHKLFSPEDGVFFKKSHWDIDELLFIKRLYEDTRRIHKINLMERISSISQSPLEMGHSEDDRTRERNRINRSLEIARKSYFFNIAAYYKLREWCDSVCPDINSVAFDTARYYDDKKGFGSELIKAFNELVFARTIGILQSISKGEPMHTFLRREETQQKFFDELTTNFGEDFDLRDSYKSFVNRFKRPRS